MSRKEYSQISSQRYHLIHPTESEIYEYIIIVSDYLRQYLSSAPCDLCRLLHESFTQLYNNLYT